ncbi:MAG: DUF805 domain-containing protein [Porphyrobacter sp.]|nr:DUF805 domain-containing protein [Porphyrobacter sp.]
MLDYLIQPLRQTLDFRGRARRREYLGFVLWQLAILAGVLNILSLFPHDGDGLELAMSAMFGQALIFALPMLALQVRRLHDQGSTGWWILVGFLPYVGAGWLVWLMLARGTPGDNRYGADPRSVEWDAALFE